MYETGDVLILFPLFTRDRIHRRTSWVGWQEWRNQGLPLGLMTTPSPSEKELGVVKRILAPPLVGSNRVRFNFCGRCRCLLGCVHVVHVGIQFLVVSLSGSSAWINKCLNQARWLFESTPITVGLCYDSCGHCAAGRHIVVDSYHARTNTTHH